MPMTECGHGHLYNTDTYATCPYCNKGGNAGMGRIITAENHTTPPGQTGGIGQANWNGNGGRVVGDANKTVEPEAFRKVGDTNKTIGKYEQEMGIDPIAGWLVCIRGEEKGKSYPVLSRINTVGRGENIDIRLEKDLTISHNHAKVSYERKKRKFYLSCGESKNTIYLNDDPVYNTTEINAYDVLEFGETLLVFIPFCGPRFSWETGISEE